MRNQREPDCLTYSAVLSLLGWNSQACTCISVTDTKAFLPHFKKLITNSSNHHLPQGSTGGIFQYRAFTKADGLWVKLRTKSSFNHSSELRGLISPNLWRPNRLIWGPASNRGLPKENLSANANLSGSPEIACTLPSGKCWILLSAAKATLSQPFQTELKSFVSFQQC